MVGTVQRMPPGTQGEALWIEHKLHHLRELAGTLGALFRCASTCEACAAASALTENSQNKKDLAAEAELDRKAAKDDKNWDKDGKPKSDKKFGEFLNAEIKRAEEDCQERGYGRAS